MFVVLVGPKGSGKSHIGRILDHHLGVHFFHVEPLWMAYHAQCRASGREVNIPDGILAVHPAIKHALSVYDDVCVETTGASPEILEDLLSLSPPESTLVVRTRAPLDVCLQRIATRDQTNQIPLDVETIKLVHGMSTSLEMPAAVTLENVSLSEAEIASAVLPAIRRTAGPAWLERQAAKGHVARHMACDLAAPPSARSDDDSAR
jgi:hypothetical protein